MKKRSALISGALVTGGMVAGAMFAPLSLASAQTDEEPTTPDAGTDEGRKPIQCDQIIDVSHCHCKIICIQR